MLCWGIMKNGSAFVVALVLFLLLVYFSIHLGDELNLGQWQCLVRKKSGYMNTWSWLSDIYFPFHGLVFILMITLLWFFFPARIVGWSFSSWCCKAVVWFWGLECSLSYLLVLWAVGSCICLCCFFCCCSWCLLTLSWMSVLKNKEACSLFV